MSGTPPNPTGERGIVPPGAAESAETAEEPAFLLRGVRQEKNGRLLLADIDLVLRRARVTALLGPSGAGKTSLLRLLDRLDDPVAGEVLYRGRPLDSYPVTGLRRRIGFVFQVPVLFRGTVRDNLSVAAELAGRNRDGFEGRAIRCLEESGLDGSFLDRAAAELSVGQGQRVTLARALVAEPETLLLDEPTGALDREVADRLLSTVRHLATGSGVTVVLSTHRLREAAAVADDAVVLEEGVVRRVGPASRVLAMSGPRPSSDRESR